MDKLGQGPGLGLGLGPGPKLAPGMSVLRLGHMTLLFDSQASMGVVGFRAQIRPELFQALIDCV